MKPALLSEQRQRLRQQLRQRQRQHSGVESRARGCLLLIRHHARACRPVVHLCRPCNIFTPGTFPLGSVSFVGPSATPELCCISCSSVLTNTMW